MAASCKDIFGSTLNAFSSLTQCPEDFITAQKTTAKKFTKTLKTIYDSTKSTEASSKSSADTLPELIVKDFDDEQIWQQLELQNDLSVSNLVTGVAKLLADKKKCSFHSKAKRDKEGANNERSADKKAKIGKRKDKSIEEVTTYDDLTGIKSDSEVENAEQGTSDASDEEISKLKSHIDNDKDNDDKFFDFTGDSDDDLNFDFGPLGQGGVDDDDDDGGYNDDKDGNEENDGGSDIDELNSSKPIKSNKSVRFKDIDTDKSDLKIPQSKAGDDTERTKSKKKSDVKEPNKKGSIVDDAFFKLADLEAFLDQEDKREERRQRREKSGRDEESGSDDGDDDDEDVDIFGELDSGDEDMHYEDFFDPPDMELGKKGKRKDKKPEKAERRQEHEAEETNDDDDNDFEDIGDEDDKEVEDNDDDEDGSDSNEKGDAVKIRKTLDLLADSDSEGEDINDILGGQKKHKKSTFENRQEKLKKKISEMETEAIAEKPWQLLGEITAASRPENSLLQENVEFEHTTRLPPEITEETTKTLEELILQRIKDKAFDDVERKVKPKDNPFEYKKRITLDQEKSKMSLGQIYEQEYLKQQKKEAEEKTDPDHDDIKKMLQSLFIKLDALSNFHYTPKQAAPEVKIISNQPSISMEEVAPVSVSDNKMLAPEEVKEKQKGELMGDTEKTKTDKLRERKKKKADKRERQAEREKRQKLIEKLNPGLGNKYSKEKAMKQLEKESKTGRGITLVKDDKKQKTGLTSSKAFFTQLQDEVSTHINSKKAEKRKKEGKIHASSKKFKL